MDTFIRAAEVWCPSADGSLLEWQGGLYGSATAFARASRGLCFGRGEGLPGQVWAQGVPLLLPRLEGSVFRRTAAAHAAGLHAAAALPVFHGEQLASVVLLFCAAADGPDGTIELWHDDPPRSATPALSAQTAASAGLVRGLALPCATPQHGPWVLNLKSTGRRPIARRVESWLPDASGTRFQRAFGHCERAGTLAAGAPIESLRAAASALEGPVGRAFAEGRAQVADDLPAHPDACTASAAAEGLGTVLALPVMAGAAVGEVLALYF